MNIVDLIHFKYVGGGYFRDSRVPKGTTAPVLHGTEIIDVIHAHLNPPEGTGRSIHFPAYDEHTDTGHHSLPGNDETTCGCDSCAELNK